MIWLQKGSNMASTNTDLHTAVRNGDVAALQAAIAAGADINTKDQHKRSPLVLAAWAGQIVSQQHWLLLKGQCKLYHGISSE
jgi:ankyrin repeat protein